MPYRDPDERRRYQREWVRRRRAVFFDGKACVRCGSTENLELHHRDPDAKVSHRIWTWSVGRLAAELAKCEVVCDSCHNALHATLKRSPCGTHSSYRQGCKCPLCRYAHNEHNARYRKAAAG